TLCFHIPLPPPRSPPFPYTTLFRSPDHRSCISSRLNLRKVPPQGSPCLITCIACCMAFSRSGVINAGRYGLNTATGLFRLVIRRSEEHTSELQSLTNLVCRLLLETH